MLQENGSPREQVGIVTEGAPQNPLAETRWLVTSLRDPQVGGIGVVLPGSTVTMAFDRTGKVNGSSGCNSYSASYLVSGSQLTITLPSGTGMLCSTPVGIMEQEAVFLALLPSVGSYSIEGTKLTLKNATG
jgi:heat shock protein HslJ